MGTWRQWIRAGICSSLLLGAVWAEEEAPVQYPLVYRWDFETIDVAGQERFAMEAVPIFYSDQRASQENWRQVFGMAASRSQPDRFPRHTPAHYVRDGEAVSGNRSLRLQSEGDNLLISLANERKKKIFGEAEVTFRGWVKTLGLEHGRLRIVLRFFRDGYEIPGSRLTSAPIGGASSPEAGAGEGEGGEPSWKRHLLIQDRAPIDAEEFDIQILLEGSFRDERATVWLDDFEVEIMPGVRLAWPGRSNLLIQPGEPVELQVECFGLNRGRYQVRVAMRRTWPEPPSDARTLRFESTRYVTSPRVPLRLLEDLRARFFLGEEDLGPGLYEVEVQILWNGEVISTGRNEFAWVGTRAEFNPTPTVRFGWILPFENRDGLQFRDLYNYQGSGFPLHQVVLDLGDWSPVRRTLTQSRPTVEATLTNLKTLVSGDASVNWSARIQWGDVPAEAWKKFFLDALPGLRMWHIRSDRPLSQEEQDVLVELKRESPILEFGFKPDARGRIPRWAQFRVVEVEPGQPPGWPEGVRPSPKDWAIVRLPPHLAVEERVAFFGRSVIDLTQSGFRKIFLTTPGDFFRGPGNDVDEYLPPDPYLLAWIGAGRFLARTSYLRDYDWSSGPGGRGVFRLFNDYGSVDTLVAYSEGSDRFPLELWTGERIRGRDLLGSEVEIPFDASTGISTIFVNPVPQFISPLPTGRVETALSLRRKTPNLRPWPRTQELVYEVRNRLARTIELELELEVLETDGWKQRPLTGSRTLQPRDDEKSVEEQYRAWSWEVDLPQPPPLLREYPFRLVMKLGEGGREFRYAHEDEILLGSDVAEVTVDPIPLTSSVIPFRLLNIWGNSLRLQVFSRILAEGGGGPSRIWNQVYLPRVPPAILRSGDRARMIEYSRELRFALPGPVRSLEGQEVWIGFQVGGRGDFNTFAFKVLVDSSGVRLER